MLKNPSKLKLKVTDLDTDVTGNINNYYDIVKQKNILDEINIKSNLTTDLPYYNRPRHDESYNIIQTDVTIESPPFSCPKSIGLFYLFEYSGLRDPRYLQNYNLSVRKNGAKYTEGKFVTGEKTGFLLHLVPGTYTFILSGRERSEGFIY